MSASTRNSMSESSVPHPGCAQRPRRPLLRGATDQARTYNSKAITPRQSPKLRLPGMAAPELVPKRSRSAHADDSEKKSSFLIFSIL